MTPVNQVRRDWNNNNQRTSNTPIHQATALCLEERALQELRTEKGTMRLSLCCSPVDGRSVRIVTRLIIVL